MGIDGCFLTEATDIIDDQLNDDDRRTLGEDLLNAMNNAYRLFGEHSFRKWPNITEKRNPPNKPLLETWGVVLATYDWHSLEPRRNAIVAAARQAMTDDLEFLDAITTSTGDPKKVRTRFLKVSDIARSAQ